jgi:hypothetical protein
VPQPNLAGRVLLQNPLDRCPMPRAQPLQQPQQTDLRERDMAALRTLFGALPNVLSLLALVVSLGTAGWVASTRWPSALLAKYDFSSPEAALRSELTMTRDGDFDAIRAHYREFHRGVATEALKTLKVESTKEFKGAKILFVSFTDRGEPVRECRFFIRDAESGLWGEDRKLRTRLRDREVTNTVYRWESEETN